MERLLKEYNGARLMVQLIPDPDVGYSMIENHIYRVQSHRRFFGITYWKTLKKTTDYWVAKAAYYLMTVKDENIGF